MCECFARKYVCNLCMPGTTPRIGHQVFWHWSYRLLWTTVWMLEIKLGFPGRASIVLCCWAIYPDPVLLFLVIVSLIDLIWLHWLASKVQGSFCLCLPRAGIIGMPSCAQILSKRVLRSKFRPKFILCSGHFTNWTIFLAYCWLRSSNIFFPHSPLFFITEDR